MGCDVSALSNHDLDISDGRALAKELSERLHWSITYRYYAYPVEWAKLLDPTVEEDWIEMATFEVPNSEYNLFLTDDNYVDRLLYQRYGRQLLEMPEVKKYYPNATSREHRFLNRSHDPCYTLEVPEDSVDGGYVGISMESLNLDWYWIRRWWGFCYLFTDYLDSDDYEAFELYRYNMMKMAKKLGGDRIYYVNDQEPVLKGVGIGTEHDWTWDKIERFIREKAGDRLWYWPDIATGKVVIPDLYYAPKEEMPIAIFDDYSDHWGM